MLDTSKFFEAFDKAGFLKTALWTPSTGGAQQSAQVRYHAPTLDALSSEVKSVDYSINYPSALLPGLKRGEVITLNGIIVGGIVLDGVQFTVRENPESQLDGSRLEAKLRKGA
jgi:hypothetical protein